MISLAGGPMGPLHSGVAASGDWTTVAVLVVFIAIALAAIAVIDYRTYRKAKPQPSREQRPDALIQRSDLAQDLAGRCLRMRFSQGDGGSFDLLNRISAGAGDGELRE